MGSVGNTAPPKHDSPRLEEQQQELEGPRGGLRRDREDRVQGEASGPMGLEERVRQHCWLFSQSQSRNVRLFACQKKVKKKLRVFQFFFGFWNNPIVEHPTVSQPTVDNGGVSDPPPPSRPYSPPPPAHPSNIEKTI